MLAFVYICPEIFMPRSLPVIVLLLCLPLWLAASYGVR